MGVSVDGIGEAVAVAMAVAVEVLPGTGVSSSLDLPTCPHANVMTSEKNSIVHTKALCFFIINSLHYIHYRVFSIWGDHDNSRDPDNGGEHIGSSRNILAHLPALGKHFGDWDAAIIRGGE
jgi:hypothetical protein